MKRSEMLKKLYIAADKYFEEGNNLNENFIDYILDQSIALGMQPPAQEYYAVTDMSGKSLGILQDIYEWEPEDKVMPSSLSEEEIKELTENDEDLQNEKK